MCRKTIFRRYMRQVGWKIIFLILMTVVLIIAITFFYITNFIINTNSHNIHIFHTFKSVFYTNNDSKHIHGDVFIEYNHQFALNNALWNDLKEDINSIVKVNTFTKQHNKQVKISENKMTDTMKTSNVYNQRIFKTQKRASGLTNNLPNTIYLSVVACGDREEDVMVLLKSAVLLTPGPLVFCIFSDDQLGSLFKQWLRTWPISVLERVKVRLFNISYPSNVNTDEWKKLFKPCASQRLFIPNLLYDVDSLIYVDTDILFLTSLRKLWRLFGDFNDSQSVALVPESEDAPTGWYNRFARHPYVYPLGVNSGVMLMNLTRLRKSSWLPSMIEYYNIYGNRITWGDQDLINIYFHFHPDELFLFSCQWNFRPDHCMYSSVCSQAERHGVHVLHGSRGVMHNDKQPAFAAVYRAFKRHSFEGSLHDLLRIVKQEVDSTTFTNCGKISHLFFTTLSELADESNDH